MNTEADIQLHLDAVEKHMATNRKSLFLLVKHRILTRLNYDNGYLDGIFLDDVPLKARNVIGPVVRTLMKQKRIEKTGNYRRSLRKESAGRVVWQYRLVP